MGDENTSVEVMDPSAMNDSEMDAFFDKGELPRRPEGSQAGQSDDAEVEADDEGAAQADGETGDDHEADQAADGEPSQSQEESRKPKVISRQERRLIRANDELKAARAEIERLRTERSAQQAGQQTQEQKATRKPAPKLKDFETWEKYEDARDAHDAETRRLDIEEWAKERDAKSAQERTAAEEATASQERGKSFAKRADEYRKELGDKDDFKECYDEVLEATLAPQYHDIAAMLVESEVGPRMVKFFADNPAELDKLKAVPTSARARAFGRLEADPRFKPVTPNKKTSVKRTGSDLGGRGSSSDLEDQISEALARGDDRTADRLMDKLDKQQAAGR